MADYDYHLPPELIAQVPLKDRTASRLLVLDRETGAIEHSHFAALPDHVRPGDLLVFNDSRVIPARLRIRRQTGGAGELLLLRQELDVERWVLMGHSIGATLALEYAARHPERVVGVVYVSGMSDAAFSFATWKQELERQHPGRIAVTDPAGKLRGVLTADFTLTALSEFVAGLSVSEHSKVFLFTDDQVLLAHPDRRTVSGSGGSARLLTLADLSDPLVEAYRANLKSEQLAASDGEEFHRFHTAKLEPIYFDM